MKFLDITPHTYTCLHCFAVMTFTVDIICVFYHFGYVCPNIPCDEAPLYAVMYDRHKNDTTVNKAITAHLCKHPKDMDETFYIPRKLSASN